ncbi:MAG: NAD(P)H-hydrate dehydratase [Acidimicrobiia bacterium]|nr:NAD(P)H-hydrate dehydratase [Acidimicrobiia bacterium]
MIPVVTPEEMGAIDRAAPEPTEVLIGRAAAAVARQAVELLGGTYGRRVVVLAGKGNNGNDGRVAGELLERRGVRVQVQAADDPTPLPECDLVLDAAFGTGFRGKWSAPEIPSGVAVLAVDIPSAVDGLTGRVAADSRALRAVHTVTFAAVKPGLLFADGAALSGSVHVADIGLDVSGARTHLVTDADVAQWLPRRPAETHKWRSAVWVVAGSPGMAGAAALTCAGAQRTGAGYVRCSTPGADLAADAGLPVEVVRHPLADGDWAADVMADLDRFGALALGNGIGRAASTAEAVRTVVRNATCPVVLDADGLRLLGEQPQDVLGPHVVLTPHDGEFEALVGAPPGEDRIEAARSAAQRFGAVLLLKGPTTVVAAPDGAVAVVTSGDSRLATAGTGDVLAGMVAALVARGLDPWRAAAAAAHLHGRAAALGWADGFVAGDLPDLVPRVLP